MLGRVKYSRPSCVISGVESTILKNIENFGFPSQFLSHPLP